MQEPQHTRTAQILKHVVAIRAIVPPLAASAFEGGLLRENWISISGEKRWSIELYDAEMAVVCYVSVEFEWEF